MCGRLNSVLPTPKMSILQCLKYVTLHGKRDFEDVNEVIDLKIGRLFRWAQPEPLKAGDSLRDIHRREMRRKRLQTGELNVPLLPLRCRSSHARIRERPLRVSANNVLIKYARLLLWKTTKQY